MNNIGGIDYLGREREIEQVVLVKTKVYMYLIFKNVLKMERHRDKEISINSE